MARSYEELLKIQEGKKPKNKEEKKIDLRSVIPEENKAPTKEKESYLSRVVKVSEDIVEDYVKMPSRLSSYADDSSAMAEEAGQLVKKGQYKEGAKTLGKAVQTRIGGASDLVFSNIAQVGRTILAPVTPLIEDAIGYGIESTGGEGGFVSKAIEYGEDFTSGIEDNIVKGLLGVKEEGASLTTEGFLGAVGIKGGKMAAPYTNKLASSISSSVGKGVSKLSKYTSLRSKADDGINSALIKTDLSFDDDIDMSPVKAADLETAVSSSVKNLEGGLDKYLTTLKQLEDAKSENDFSLSTATQILNDNGFKSIADYVIENETKIVKTNYIKTIVNQLEGNQELKRSDKSFMDNAENAPKTEMINTLLDEGVLKYNGISKTPDGREQYSFIYTEDAKANLFGKTTSQTKEKGYHMDKELYDNVSGKTPDKRGNNPIDKVINIMKGRDFEIEGINQSFNRIGKDVTAEGDFIAYVNRLNEKYNLGLNREIGTLQDSFDIDGAKKLADILQERKEKYFFGNNNYMATEFRNLKHKLSIEQKIIDTAFKAGKKEQAKISKEKYNEQILKLNKANQSKIDKLKEKYKKANEKQKAKIKEQIANIKAANKRKIEEIKIQRDGKLGAIKYVIGTIKKALNDKKYKGVKINGLLSEMTRLMSKGDLKKETFMKTLNNILTKLHTQYQKNLLAEIKKEASVIRSFSKNKDAAERKKYSALFTLMGNYQKTYDKALLASKGGMPIEMLETILSEIKEINNASLEFSRRIKENEGKRVAILTKKITDENASFKLFGDTGRTAGTEYKTILSRLGGIQNFFLYWVQAAKLMSKNSPTFMRMFVDLPSEAKARYVAQLDDLNDRATLIYDKIKDVSKSIKGKGRYAEAELYVRSAMGVYGMLSRRIETDTGDVWIGAEKLISSMYDNQNKIREEWKGKDWDKRELDERPEGLEQMPEALWEKLAGTKALEMYRLVKDNELDKQMDIIFDDFANSYESFKYIAAQDGALVQKHKNYVPFFSKDGGVDVVGDISSKKTFNTITDNFMHNTTNSKAFGGNEIELDIMKLYTSGMRNQIYYTQMKPTLDILKDLYFGQKMTADDLLYTYKLVNNEGKVVYNQDKFDKAGLRVVNSNGSLGELKDGDTFEMGVYDIRKNGGINEKFGKEADYRVKDFLNRIATGGIDQGGEFLRVFYPWAAISNGAAMSMNISPILKQGITYVDVLGDLSATEMTKGLALMNGKIELDGKQMSVYDHVLRVSPMIKTRLGGQNVLRDLKNADDFSVFGARANLQKFIQMGTAPLGATDRLIAIQLFLAKYAKIMKEKNPDITDAEIRLLNDNRAVGEANRLVKDVMSISDDLMTAPALGNLWGKIFFSLQGTMMNRYGKFLVDFTLDKDNVGIYQAMAQNSWFIAGNILDTAITYYVAYLRYSLGLSLFDIEKELEDKNLFIETMLANGRSIPILGDVITLIENPDFGASSIYGVPTSLTKGTIDLIQGAAEGEDKQFIRGGVNLLRGLGFGELSRIPNLTQ